MVLLARVSYVKENHCKGPHFVIASGSFYFKREKDVTATPVPIFIQNSLLQ
jgi:hypothetical protein